MDSRLPEIEQTSHTLASSLKVQGKEFDYKDYSRWMNEQLTLRISSLAVSLLGNPTYKRPTEWRYGDKKHLVVHVGGKWQGWFHDFETGERGDALQLVKNKTGYTGKALSEWVKSFIGHAPNQSPKELSSWKPIIPVPKEVLPPDIEGNKYLNYMLKDGNKEVARYAYCDEQGRLKGYVFRFERPNPDDPGGKNLKITPPLAYCQNEKGFKAWRWQGFFGDQKTAYGLEKLAQDPSKPVLVVEGEKKADAAQKMLPEYHLLSWIGGAGNVGKTNWDCLAGREVILWPDHDEPGVRCMECLKTILRAAQCISVKIVQLPKDTPKGWDLADAWPEGWNQTTLDNLIKDSV